MSDSSVELLVEQITKEVLRSLGKNLPEAEPDTSGFPEILVIGSKDLLPKYVRDRYCAKGMEEYIGSKEIARFEKIYITELATSELVDIALGRSVHAVEGAVIDALMNGKEIFLMDSALLHRKLATKASRGFYQMLEGYVRTLQSFGINLISAQSPIRKYTGQTLPQAALLEDVITESLARSIVSKNKEKDICFRKGTVLTPSAKDVFLHADKVITFV